MISNSTKKILNFIINLVLIIIGELAGAFIIGSAIFYLITYVSNGANDLATLLTSLVLLAYFIAVNVYLGVEVL